MGSDSPLKRDAVLATVDTLIAHVEAAISDLR